MRQETTANRPKWAHGACYRWEQSFQFEGWAKHLTRGPNPGSSETTKGQGRRANVPMVLGFVFPVTQVWLFQPTLPNPLTFPALDMLSSTTDMPNPVQPKPHSSIFLPPARMRHKRLQLDGPALAGGAGQAPVLAIAQAVGPADLRRKVVRNPPVESGCHHSLVRG